LRRFKDETADLHLEAERYVRILDRDATLDDYRRYLAAMYGFHAPLERQFAASDALIRAGFAPQVRQKAHLILADLNALGAAQPVTCACLPAVDSLPRAVGAAYVIEGSTLGGRFILAKLPPSIATVRGEATRFLEGYGSETGARWRAFAQVAAVVVDEDSAVAAARETFAKLIDWLARHEVRGSLPLAEAS
jgi:heme oxygenase